MMHYHWQFIKATLFVLNLSEGNRLFKIESVNIF